MAKSLLAIALSFVVGGISAAASAEGSNDPTCGIGMPNVPVPLVESYICKQSGMSLKADDDEKSYNPVITNPAPDYNFCGYTYRIGPNVINGSIENNVSDTGVGLAATAYAPNGYVGLTIMVRFAKFMSGVAYDRDLCRTGLWQVDHFHLIHKQQGGTSSPPICIGPVLMCGSVPCGVCYSGSTP